MIRLPIALFLAFIACVSISGKDANQKLPQIADKVELQDGDTLVFLGDSITHQCLYSQYVETYFYTRYPERRIRFYNAGVSGDKAGDALLRFGEDVASVQPDHVSILLGMNDGTYRHFDHEVFQRYESGMNELLNRLQGSALAVPMTPTLFDSRSMLIKPDVAHWIKEREDSKAYYGSVLAFYGAWLSEQSLKRGLGFVDMNSPLRAITLDQRIEDAGFSMITDAVHPEAAGHVVMATAMLNDMFAKSNVSDIRIVRHSKKKFESLEGRGTVTNLKRIKNGLSFEFLAPSLPWVLPSEAQLGYDLTDAGSTYSLETLRVVGLEFGNYALSIDGVVVGTYTAIDLSAGIELQGNSNTPQYAQALQVAQLNKERNLEAIKPLRNTWLNRRNKLRVEERWLAENRGADDFAERLARFNVGMKDFYKKVEDAKTLANEYEEKIYQANQVKMRAYELVRLKG